MKNLKKLFVILAVVLALSGCQNPFLQLGSASASGSGEVISGIKGIPLDVVDPEDSGETGEPKKQLTGAVTVKFYYPDHYYGVTDLIYTQEVFLVDGVTEEDIDWVEVSKAYFLYYTTTPSNAPFTGLTVAEDMGWFYDYSLFNLKNNLVSWYFNTGSGVEHYPGKEPVIDFAEQCVEIGGQYELSLAPKFEIYPINVVFLDTDGVTELHSETVNIAPCCFDEFIDAYFKVYDAGFLETAYVTFLFWRPTYTYQSWSFFPDEPWNFVMPPKTSECSDNGNQLEVVVYPYP